MLLERIFPDQQLKYVPGWWKHVVLINICQLLVVILGMYTWERAFRGPPLFTLGSYLENILPKYLIPSIGGFTAYIINTWIFYWWHLARHEIYIFWRLFHQLHHSAQRIEAITSFYKHPLEIIVDSIMITILLYPVLGLPAASSIWMSAFSAFGEFFYHMNIRTPQWIGMFFQRPESHRIHHARNKRVSCQNFADFPLWDILNGTWKNPKVMNKPTGFTPENERKISSMIQFKDVLNESKTFMTSREFLYKMLIVRILVVGCLQPVGYLFNSPNIRGLGLVTVSSPLPLVFSSYNGVETFSTMFTLNVTTHDNITTSVPMSLDLCNMIDGPYNRRNVYGAIFSHGPFFVTENLIRLRQQILDYGVCKDGLSISSWHDVFKQVKAVTVIVASKTIGNENKQWLMHISCQTD